MTTENDFVAGKLGLWERGQPCFDAGLHYCRSHPDQLDNLHDTTAPDLLANPWLLVEALWERDLEISLDGKFQTATLYSATGVEEASVRVIDGDLARALLGATYEMLKKEK